MNFGRAITEPEIEEVIQAYGRAARRAAEAGADGVNVAASGGYLLNEFLSPFFNHRKDQWGGTDENRFRLLKEVLLEVRRNLHPTMALTVKMTANDYTPLKGLTTPLAIKYAGWLAELGVDGLEIASGNTTYSGFHIWRGDVPVKEMLPALPTWQRPAAWALFKFWDGRYNCYEGYNLMDAYPIKRAIGDVPFTLVGGLRHLTFMEKMVEKGPADLIGLSRPLIREPNLVKKFKEGKSEVSTCVSCNKCFADCALEQAVRCHA
jgi:2,4-dienoyl-CoA reductase-like NADH-dependent reductase (Old Yellow Enzyme family)